MKKVLKNKKAFTLTEMIVVIAIIGILAGVLIPSVVSYINKAQENAAYQQAVAAYDIYEVYETELEAGLIHEIGKVCYVDNNTGQDVLHDYNDGDGVCSECNKSNTDTDSNYEDFAEYYEEMVGETLTEGDGYDHIKELFVFTADNGIIVNLNVNDMSADYK